MQKGLYTLLIRPFFLASSKHLASMQRQHVTFKLNNDSTQDKQHHEETTSSNAPVKHNKRVSVAIVIIGDEIIKGHVADTNSHFLCHRLTAVGAEVQRISVLPDNKEVIAKEIKHLHKQVRWILAVGGIGPTHDDVTFEGIAAAFKYPLEKNEVLINLIRQHFHKPPDVPLTFAEEKMATVPVHSAVLFGDIRNGDTPVPDSESIYLKPGMFPVVRTDNVLVLPGIPILLQRAFNNIRNLFESEEGALAVQNVYVKLDELSFAETLSAIADIHKANVVIGSYPDLTNNYYRVKVMFESAYSEALEAAVTAFIKAMPADSVILDPPTDVIAEAEERVYNFSHPSAQLCSKVKHALSTVESALSHYGQDGIALCFTGGKDATVVLHILYAALRHTFPKSPVHLLALQLSTFEPFAEVDRFIYETKRRYGFQFESYVGSGMKESLEKFVAHHPNVKAVFMGTRRNDPSGAKLSAFQKTDQGWPELMRVSPILDWSYSEVWTFIRHLHLPYCSLYDRGYTSLGNPSTTHPNRLLLTQSPTTMLLHYRPAYELEDDSTERAGRDPPQATQVQSPPNTNKKN